MRIRSLLPAPLLGLAFAACLAQAQTAEIAVTVTDEQGRPVADAVLIAVPVDGSVRPAQRAREGSVNQVDKEFAPRVTVVQLGASVSFPNHDDVRHQVYSFSPAKRFELPLYAGVPAQPIVFDKPGVVVLGCNIHDWMVGYIYVSESPFYAKTEADGRATINGLPREEARVRVWHPDMTASEDSTARSLAARENNSKPTEWRIELKPTIRVRRAPISEHGGSRY